MNLVITNIATINIFFSLILKKYHKQCGKCSMNRGKFTMNCGTITINIILKLYINNLYNIKLCRSRTKLCNR